MINQTFKDSLRNFGIIEESVLIAQTGEIVDMLHLESHGDLWAGSPMDERREVYLVGFNSQAGIWVAFHKFAERITGDDEQQIKAWYLKQRRRR